MVRNIKICPKNYIKTPTEFVQNFTTIEFVIVENPHTYHQIKKRPAQKRFEFTEFSLSIGQTHYGAAKIKKINSPPLYSHWFADQYI